MKLLQSLVLVLTFGLWLPAQEYRGTIQGRVEDPSGSVIPAANIAVQNVETGVTVSTKTNEEGNFQVPFLLPGNYTVRRRRRRLERSTPLVRPFAPRSRRRGAI